jgi:hypothetical protein
MPNKPRDTEPLKVAALLIAALVVAWLTGAKPKTCVPNDERGLIIGHVVVLAGCDASRK